MINQRVWRDQAEFNTQLHGAALPSTHEELSAITKEFTLHQMTEMAEFLEAGHVWPSHRRRPTAFVNRENVRRQLIDQFKYWMGIAQAWGFTPEELERTYWSKTATVRQRFAEEWLIELDKPIAVLDLDGVLCDYVNGFTAWLLGEMSGFAPSGEQAAAWKDNLLAAMRKGQFLCAETIGVPVERWNAIQHAFRESGETARLPRMPDATDLIRFVRARGWAVVALTSRPIGEYPNLYDDTVRWMTASNITCDRIWWGANKAEKLASVVPNLPQVRFAVDDDPRFVTQLIQLGVERVYWVKSVDHGATVVDDRVVPVKRLAEICIEENKRS